MNNPLMSRVREARAKHIAPFENDNGWGAEIAGSAWDECAQFVLAELSRESEGVHGPRMMAFSGGGLKYNNQFIFTTLNGSAARGLAGARYVAESELIAARASHAVEVEKERSNKEGVHRWNEKQAELIRSLDEELTAERDRVRKLREALKYLDCKTIYRKAGESVKSHTEDCVRCRALAETSPQ